MPLIEKGRDYQENVIREVFNAWAAGLPNVCLVAPTGAGKTIIKALVAKYFLQNNPNALIVIFAHRDVLLSQISLAAAKVGLPHRLMCAQTTKVQISHTHIDELGQSYISDSATIVVASVPTWIKRDTKALSPQVALWLMDEFHHCLEENMWGQSIKPMSNAFGLGVTATPKRADGKGLGRKVMGGSGLADTIVQTPGMGELINMGNLSNYKVYTIPNDLDVSDVNVTSSGDYNQRKLAIATKKSHIIGDAIHHYKRLADGKQGIIFAASVEHAEIVASQFRNAGYSAAALSSKSNVADTFRHATVKRFRKGQLQLLVNYDLFGEGFDVPSVEVVILLRKTLSYSLFKQMFGRALRPFEGKEYGILIDHVGNVREHCLPGKHLHEDPEWSLANVDKRKSSGQTKDISRTCPKCFAFYTPASQNITSYVCPFCGHAESQEERNDAQKEIQTKDGVLVEYDTGFYTEMLGKIKQVDMPVDQFKRRMQNAPPVVAASAVKRHAERQNAQGTLRPWIGEWCDQMAKFRGLDVETTRGEFERYFGVNIYKAQTLSSSDSQILLGKIKSHLIESMFDTLI